jgi:hypothetical protein
MPTAYASLTLSGAARAMVTYRGSASLWPLATVQSVSRYVGAMHLHRTLTPPAWLLAQLFCFHRQRRFNRLAMAGFAY